MCTRQRDVLHAARDEAEAAARISRARQREGEIDFLSVLDAERTFAESESRLAASNAQVARPLVGSTSKTETAPWSPTDYTPLLQPQ